MTKSQILKTAHEHAREFRRLYPSYRAAFAESLQVAYRDVRNPPPVRCTGFQIKEPCSLGTMNIPTRGCSGIPCARP